MRLKLLTLLALGLSYPEMLSAQSIDGKRAEMREKLGLNGVTKDTTDLYLKDLEEYNSREGKVKYNTYTSNSTEVHKFDNQKRTFKDWAISVGGGVSFLVYGDLESTKDDKITPGYAYYVSLDKQISHTFGISLQYQGGQTKQYGRLLNQPINATHNGQVIYYNSLAGNSNPALRGLAEAKTKFHQLSFLGDINFSNFLRRMDNFSTYRWALHGYLGVGLQNFSTYRKDQHPVARYANNSLEQDLDVASFFYQGGLGLKFKVNRMIDLEGRAMYIISGDDEFDGGGDVPNEAPGYNLIRKNNSDNALTATLGISVKLGKKDADHLAWYDPMKEIYYRTRVIEENLRTEVCEAGDKDNDGVCDDWDRQLDTPAGARVDGAGVALDIDLDGVIDLHDKCVTNPGKIEFEGCVTQKK